MASKTALQRNFLRYGDFHPSVLDRIKGIFQQKQFIGLPANVNYGFTSVIPNANNTKFITEGYDKSANLYSVVRKIAKTCSYAPWGMYRVKNEKAYRKYTAMSQMHQTKESMFGMMRTKADALEPVDDKMNELFARPNSQQGGVEYLEGVFTYKLLTGNAYENAVLLDFGANAGKPQEFYLLPSQYMEIKADAGFPVELEGYILNDGTQKSFNPEEVMHSKYFNPNYSFTGEHLYGFSPLSAGWLSTVQDNDAKKAAIELLQNRGPRGILFSEIMAENPNMAKEQAGLLKERWRQTRMEEKGGVVPMPGKGAYEQIGLSIADLKILEISNYTMRDICNIYGVWAGLFNSGDNQKYDNVSQFRKDFIINVVLPELNQRKSILNHKLQTDWGYKDSDLVADYDESIYPELQEDLQKSAEMLNKSWWFTGNEKRVYMGWDLNKNPLMDEIMVPQNLIPLNDMNIENLPETELNGE